MFYKQNKGVQSSIWGAGTSALDFIESTFALHLTYFMQMHAVAHSVQNIKIFSTLPLCSGRRRCDGNGHRLARLVSVSLIDDCSIPKKFLSIQFVFDNKPIRDINIKRKGPPLRPKPNVLHF